MFVFMCIIIYTHIGAEETCFQGKRTGSRRKEKKSHEGPAKEVESLIYGYIYIYMDIYIYIYINTCTYIMYTHSIFSNQLR